MLVRLSASARHFHNQWNIGPGFSIKYRRAQCCNTYRAIQGSGASYHCDIRLPVLDLTSSLRSPPNPSRFSPDRNAFFNTNNIAPDYIMWFTYYEKLLVKPRKKMWNSWHITMTSSKANAKPILLKRDLLSYSNHRLANAFS